MAVTIRDEYKKMLESITAYKGFYIGRFELSGTVESPTLVQGGTVLINKNWYELYNACSKFTTVGAVSRMIYGCQWDVTCKFISERGGGTRVSLTDSSAYGNYSGTVRTSGYNESWRTHNIYDLAGNVREWVQDAYNQDCRCLRGGDCADRGSVYPVTIRNYTQSNSSWSLESSRPMMYVL